MYRIKFIALDVDGTLAADFDRPMSPRVTSVLQRASQSLTLAFITGRSKGEMEPIFEQLGSRRFWIATGGGAEIFNPDGELVYAASMPIEQVELVRKRLPEELPIVVLVDDEWLNYDPADVIAADVQALLAGPVLAVEADKWAKRLQPGFPDLSVSRVTDPHDLKRELLFFQSETSNKGRAVQFLQTALDLLPEECAAIGDMPLDLPMFRVVGLSAAMANGTADVKAAANVLVADVREDGAAEFIDSVLAKNS
jgi:hydroxymethylpyrimidine pyrophosphatase-like HAD family hydrolase